MIKPLGKTIYDTNFGNNHSGLNVGCINNAANVDLVDYKDKYLQVLADFENYKRHKEKEIERIRKTANKELILRLLPALDDCKTAYAMSSDKNGLELIYRKISNVINEFGVSEYGYEGETFDPNLHNAISLSSGNIVGNGNISEVFKNGYIMNGEIIRHADVVVEQS